MTGHIIYYNTSNHYSEVLRQYITFQTDFTSLLKNPFIFSKVILLSKKPVYVSVQLFTSRIS